MSSSCSQVHDGWHAAAGGAAGRQHEQLQRHHPGRGARANHPHRRPVRPAQGGRVFLNVPLQRCCPATARHLLLLLICSQQPTIHTHITSASAAQGAQLRDCVVLRPAIQAAWLPHACRCHAGVRLCIQCTGLHGCPHVAGSPRGIHMLRQCLTLAAVHTLLCRTSSRRGRT